MNIKRAYMETCLLAAGGVKKFWRDKEGLGTLEVVLIAAVIIAIAVLFRDWILEFLDSLFGKVEDKSESFFG